MYTEKQKTSNTEQFVNMISKRLSGRKDAQKCEYKINIMKIDNQNIVELSPLFYVYPNKHRRSDIDKRTILDFALDRLFGSKFRYKWNTSVQIVINDDCFVSGCYVYKKYENANRRKWIKI